MWSSASVAALALALLQGTNALGGPFQHWEPPVWLDRTSNIAASKSVNSRAVEPPYIDPEYIELPLDHFGSHPGTFRNRYWVNARSYKPGGPVFLFDKGEGDAGPGSDFTLNYDGGFFKKLMDEFNGIGIVWEHRFYGKSTPVNITLDTPPEAFRFLTVEQALADVDSFAKQFSRPGINATLTPDQTPWVVVGGSYAGGKAAFLRNMYPDTIYASWAASAVLEAALDTSYYYDVVWDGMNAKGFGNCTRDIQAALRYMDEVMDKGPEASAKLKEQFLGPGAANTSNGIFADVAALVHSPWQFDGIEGYPDSHSIRFFCDWLETDPKTNKTAPHEGWAPSKGGKWAADRWAAYPSFVALVNDVYKSNCSGHGNKTVGNCSLDGPTPGGLAIGWTWQTCTQLGYYRPTNLGPRQLGSKYNSFEHQRDLCHIQFPTATPPLFPYVADPARINKALGGWSVRPSNTYWSTGEYDPWRPNTPASQLPYAPKVQFTQEIPKCGVSPGKDKLFGMMIKDGGHLYDWNEPGFDRPIVPDREKSQELFKQALKAWLPCFKPKKVVAKGWSA